MAQQQFTGQTYGQATQQREAMRAVPTAQPPTEVTAPAPRPSTPLTPLTAPTERPNEPITAGAPFGPGIGPEAAGIIPTPEPTGDVLSTLEYLNRLYPNRDLGNLIDALRRGG